MTDGGGPEEPDVRERLLAAASVLIANGGPEAATTRAVASAAGVQAPALYRLFGDKQGLLAAVIEDTLSRYVAEKALRAPHPDPLQDFRDGWDLHVAFGLGHPGLFAIMSSTPRPTWRAAASAGDDVLRRRIRNLAHAGMLKVTEDRAIDLTRSMGTGVVLTLLQAPEDERDLGLADAARESVIASITTERAVRADAGVKGIAMALRAQLARTEVLTRGELLLMSELLDRIAGT